MDKLILVVPTRGRPLAASDLADLFHETATSPDTVLLFAVDDDDEYLPDYLAVVHVAAEIDDRIQITVNPRLRMVPTLNLVAADLADSCHVIGFMGDDHRPRTHGWDETILAILAGRTGVAYGNDLIHGQMLPTAVFVTSDTVKALGYMVPPGLIHLYADNFWLELGRKTTLTYHAELIIEHMHPIANKSAWDDRYAEVNSDATTQHDAAEFQRYMREDWPSESQRLETIGLPA